MFCKNHNIIKFNRKIDPNSSHISEFISKDHGIINEDYFSVKIYLYVIQFKFTQL